MSLDTIASELMKAIVHDNYLYRVPGYLRIGETMTVSNLAAQEFQ